MKSESSWIVEGLVAGLIGYMTVVALFGFVNLASGEPLFHTAALLGSAVFFGARSATEIVPGPGPIIAYNGVHILVALVIGLGAAWLIFQTEKNRPLWFIVFFVFLAGFIYSVVVVGVLAAELTHLLSWPMIVLANVAAGVTAGGYLWLRHSPGPDSPCEHDGKYNTADDPCPSQKSLSLLHDASVPCQIVSHAPKPAVSAAGWRLMPLPFNVQQILKRRFIVYFENSFIELCPHGDKSAVAVERAFLF